MERLYFDANATTPPLPEVVDVVAAAMRSTWGNPTSTHREGQRARHRLEEARREIAGPLGVEPGELVFCASASEGLHLLIRGLQPALGALPASVFPGEHSACLNPLREWTAIRWLPSLDAETRTIVQMVANNETGLLYAMPTHPKAVRLQDCAQAWGKVPVDLAACDAAVFSGHKIGGPRGAALLWMRSKLPWTPILEGPQERGRRAGTEDLPAILGLAEAVRHLPERLDANARLAPLRDAFEAELLSWDPAFEAIGKGRPRLPNTSCLLLRGRSGEAVHMAMDLEGIATSTGSACHSGATRPSHAIVSLGYPESEARCALRISFLPEATQDEAAQLLGTLRKVLFR